jgi:hypothetical protein
MILAQNTTLHVELAAPHPRSQLPPHNPSQLSTLVMSLQVSRSFCKALQEQDIFLENGPEMLRHPTHPVGLPAVGKVTAGKDAQHQSHRWQTTPKLQAGLTVTLLANKPVES